MPKLIGLVGKAGSGKSSAADFIYIHLPKVFIRFSFATPIKNMLEALGVPRENLYYAEKKNEPLAGLSGRSARHAMQTLGTEWGRNQMHPDFWTNLMKLRVDRAFATGLSVVIDDVRFQNEIAFVNSYASSELWLIERPGEMQIPSSAHSSEAIDELRMITDCRITNTGSLTDLERKVKSALGISDGRDS